MTILQAGGFKVVLSRTVLTSGTAATYTWPAGVYAIDIEMWGGGGGGGGVSGATSNAAASTGGNAGAYLKKHLNGTPGDQHTYTVGPGGPGGSAGANDGTAGGNTTWNDGTTTYTAPGGAGGTAQAAGTTVQFVGPGTTATATNGDINGATPTSARAARWSGTQGYPTGGANSTIGDGGSSAIGATGGNAAGKAAGGGGTYTTTNNNRAGGNGSDGLIVVTEYKVEPA